MILRLLLAVSLPFLGGMAHGQNAGKDWRQLEAGMQPYRGEHRSGVDATTIKGKVLCGYQAWFAAPGDGSGRGWVHYGAGKEFKPGACTIDLWPDMSELGKSERYPTAFKNADGSVAHVFSSHHPDTVMRHFKWMEQHGIDGVFLQRFASSLRRPNAAYQHRNQVTANVQAGANQHGRVWAMMYDLSGLKQGEIESVLIPDWKRLIDRMKITKDKAYLHHKGKPLVAVWGVGFSDSRDYSLEECAKLIRFLKEDPVYGGNTVMLGVPSFWRELKRDSVKDKKLHTIIAQADIISPWTVGRYRTPEQAKHHADTVIKQDIAWCQQRAVEFLPVMFPGFSWQNLKKSKGEEAPLNHIPRLGGRFLWSQAVAAKQAGADMAYVAMFDEVDEGTAIFKCTNTPPVGDSKFITYEGLPTDHYLWLTGEVGKLMRGGPSPHFELPIRK